MQIKCMQKLKKEIKNLSEYHDLYFKNNTLLLADKLENFWYVCLEICEVDPTHFLSALD